MAEEFVLSQVARDVQTAIDNALSPDKTLSVNGKPADAKAVGAAISQLSEEKVGINQGQDNAGKFLGIGSDGKVSPVDAPSGGSAESIGNFRHINTITLDTEEAMTIDITEDKDGNPFSCSEFFIYATIPASAASTQLYVGSAQSGWMLFCPVARSASATRTIAIETRHVGAGWWRGSLRAGDNVTSSVSTLNTGYAFTNFRSSNQKIGEKSSSLRLYGGTASFPVGSIFEVYGR